MLINATVLPALVTKLKMVSFFSSSAKLGISVFRSSNNTQHIEGETHMLKGATALANQSNASHKCSVDSNKHMR